MANAEQLALLLAGVEGWNAWRIKEPEVDVDLRQADLSGADLRGAYLNVPYLTDADYSYSGDKPIGLDINAGLIRTELHYSYLSESDLKNVNLSRANLRGSYLGGAKLVGAKLVGAKLNRADLRSTDLSNADLQRSDFSSAQAGFTSFVGVDLSHVKGLDKIEHKYGSSIDTDTLAKSVGKIPDVFLRGCGLSDWEIENAKLYNPELSNDEIAKIQYRVFELRATQALQISPLFISYSHADRVFVDKIGDCLTKKGIRYWRDIHDMKAGRLEKQIDAAIRQNPTVLLILSKNSLNSDWVEHEARTARALEKDLGRDVLCPVALDTTWGSKDNRWPKHVMEQIMEYNILDFSAWQDDSKFDSTFRKLIDGLELFYKK